MAKIADSLISPVLVVLGFVLMATPLALWVAWTDTILFAVLLTGITSGVLYCVLIHFEKPDETTRCGATQQPSQGSIPEGLVEELQDLHPFIHHHSPRGDPRFLAAMSRLRRFLEG